MVFQDGAGFVNETGHSRVPIVFDNLIHRREMPVTVGVFVSPGILPARNDSEQARFYRSYEYDAVTGRYAQFLLDEILPDVGKSFNLTSDPICRAICGSSPAATAPSSSPGTVPMVSAAWSVSSVGLRISAERWCCRHRFASSKESRCESFCRTARAMWMPAIRT